MPNEINIGFDSNVLSAFLLANRGEFANGQNDPLADERVATYRLFLHCCPFILPSVTVEAGVIPDGAKLEEHLRFIGFNFGEIILDDLQEQVVERRVTELQAFHSGPLDCKIVAEAEVGELPILVTLDGTLRKRLSAHTAVQLLSPTACWQSLAIPPGTPPKKGPGNGHPLENETWWRW